MHQTTLKKQGLEVSVKTVDKMVGVRNRVGLKKCMLYIDREGDQNMEITINNQSFYFDSTSDMDIRKKSVEDFLATKIDLAIGTMTVEEYYSHTWEKQNTKISLDRIGYYLSKMPEQKGKEDKSILNPSKELEMECGVRRTSKAANKLTEKEIEKLNLTEDDIKNNPKKRYNVFVKTSMVHYDDMTLTEKNNTGLAEVEDSE